MGGGLAITGGFGVAVVVFTAERRFDDALRRREEATERENLQRAQLAERENLKLTLSMTEALRGIDLHGRDLQGAFLRRKDLRDADLRRVNLSGATLAEVQLEGALLNDADLRGAVLGLGEARGWLIGADLTGADLRGAKIRGDIRSAVFDSADLRGADLRRSLAVHPHPERAASEEEVTREAAVFDGAKYDADTRWPDGVDPVAAGAVQM